MMPEGHAHAATRPPFSTTADVLAQGRDNNFNLIRMLAASAVIISHSAPLSLGPNTIEPLHYAIAPLDLGKAAVRVFFVISGFFILQSFDRRASIYGFVMARIARIIPALVVLFALTALMLSRGISFAHNPFPSAINGSLWTLYYEVICYGMLAGAGLCGAFRNGRFPAFLISFGLVYTAIELGILPINRAYAFLSFPFVVGMAIYHFRRHVPLSSALAAFFVLFAIGLPSDATWSVALGYGALCFGAGFKALRGYNRLGDYSYGTYIYAWPTQQLIALIFPGVSMLGMILLAMPIIWTMAFISWHFVESPSLKAAKRWQRCTKSANESEGRRNDPQELLNPAP